MLTIIKRKEALGLLAHNDTEDVFTRSRSELLALGSKSRSEGWRPRNCSSVRSPPGRVRI